MPVERINPGELAPPQGYTHLIKASGGTTLYLAGQGGYDAAGKLAAGDHRAQTRQAAQNVLAALRAGGAGWSDVVKATYYVVGVTPEVLGRFAQGLAEALGPDAGSPPAATFVGVAALAYPEMLVEIDVTAVIP